ncbi:MAG: hypothetical protein ABSD68_02225 [Candidatus Micrarchaeales archaeon]|jgi:uncharacterized membrane protein YphA (DoxX/SURF4 family)
MPKPMSNINADSWFVRNVAVFARAVEVLFGFIWLANVSIKLEMRFVGSFAGTVSQVASGQPEWLQGWFGFWVQTLSSNPVFFAYLQLLFELALGLALILGFMRKTTYAGGALLGLLLWSVPESFGGPYGPSSTDIGTGIIYTVAFLLLLALNAYKGNKYTLDALIEKHIKWWSVIAEVKR